LQLITFENAGKGTTADFKEFTKAVIQNLANHPRGIVRVPVFSSANVAKKKRHGNLRIDKRIPTGIFLPPHYDAVYKTMSINSVHNRE
jgi:hypothetical protein